MNLMHADKELLTREVCGSYFRSFVTFLCNGCLAVGIVVFLVFSAENYII